MNQQVLTNLDRMIAGVDDQQSGATHVGSVADTAAREQGVDVLARRNGEEIAIEVKGFPSRHYADPARAGETKRTQPSTQAKHWFGQAVLAAMLTTS